LWIDPKRRYNFSISPLATTLSCVHRVAMSGDSSSTAPSRVENSAMVAGVHGRGGGRGYSRELGDKSPRHCTNYGQINHMSDKYWDQV